MISPKVMVLPAILTNNVKDFKEKLKKIDFTKFIQVDIMDGKFVRNRSLSVNSLKKIKINKKVEYHLMIKTPENHIDDFLKLKPYSVVFHYEATKKADFLIKKIKSKRIRVGVALNPKTKIEKIYPYLWKIDFVLIMTVNPGFYGSKFTSSSLKKIMKLRRISKIPIEVDGHINDKTAKLVAKAGANILVSGSYIFKQNPRKAYNVLLKSLK